MDGAPQRIRHLIATSRAYQDPCVALLFLILPFLVYRFLWWFGGHETISIDYIHNQAPQQLLFLQMIRDGFWPLWAPGDSGGTPWGAYFQAQQYSPLTWLLGTCPGTYEGLQLELLTLMRLGMLGVSGFFTYLLARRLGLAALAGIAAGTVFIFNMRMLDCIRYASAVDTAVWLPVMIYLLERLLARPRLTAVCLCALAQYMLVVSGHTQVAFYCLIFYNAWLLHRLWATGREQPPCLKWVLTRAGWAILGEVCGLALSAVYWLPVVREMLPLWTSRVSGGPSYYYQYHMTWRGLLSNLFYPWFCEVANNFYSSQMTWLLLAAGALLVIRNNRGVSSQWRWTILFLLATIAICVLYSLGPLTPVAPLLNAVVPGITGFRGPGRCTIVAVFAAALVAAFAIDRLLRDPKAWDFAKRFMTVFGIIFFLAGLALLAAWISGGVRWVEAPEPGDPTWIRHRIWLPLFGEIKAVAPIRFRGNPTMLPLMAVTIMAVAGFNLIAFRLCHLGRISRAAMVCVIWLAAMIEAGIYEREGIWTRPGRVSTCRSETFKDTDVYHSRIFANRGFFRYSWRNIISPSAGDGHVVAKFDAPAPPRELLCEGGAPAWRLYYQNVSGHEIPRAYLTPRVDLVEGNGLKALRDIDPYATSVLDLADRANHDARQDEQLRAIAAAPVRDGDSRASFTRCNQGLQVAQYTPNKAVFEVNVNGRNQLFNYNDTYFAGWRCWVDGKESRIYRVNHMFKGVPLAAGQHTVEFRYEPECFRAGLVLTLGTTCLLLGMASVGLIGGRRGWLTGVVVIALAVPGAFHVRSWVNTMAYRDGLINYDPATPRCYAPDYDEYLSGSESKKS